MRLFTEVSDEHGEVTDPSVPKEFVHDQASFDRWQICEMIATKVSRKPVGDPEVTLFATTLFQKPVPTFGIEGKEIVEGQRSFNPFQWRDRTGRWIDMPDFDLDIVPESPGLPLKMSPGAKPPDEPEYTWEQIKAAGLDHWPQFTEAGKEIMLGLDSTWEKYGSEEPGQDPDYPDYATDRAAHHRELVEASLEGKVQPEGNPHALFMAGGTASGKTTTLRRNRDSLAPSVQTTVHVDVDKIKDRMGEFGMPEYDQLRAVGDHRAALAVHKEAGDIAAEMVRAASSAGLNVIIDGTGNSDPGKFANELHRAHDAEYTVDVLYVNRPTDDAIKLAIGRADRDGRYVPVPAIRKIHRKTSYNYVNEISKIPWLNSLVIYDQDGPVAYREEDGKMHIQNEQGYAAFMAKAEENLEKPSDEEKVRRLDDDENLLEEAGVPVKDWVPELSHDSSEYLEGKDVWVKQKPKTDADDASGE